MAFQLVTGATVLKVTVRGWGIMGVSFCGVLGGLDRGNRLYLKVI